MMMPDVAEIPQISPARITVPIDNSQFASPEDLTRQSAFFADVFMTRHLLDAMPGMVLVLNRFRQIVFANRAFYRLSGRSDGENLVGLLVGDVHFVSSPESGTQFTLCLPAVLPGTAGVK